MTFLGPSGVADRMAQIQARLDALTPREPRADLAFGKTLDAAMGDPNAPLDPLALRGNPLVGAIGGRCGGASEYQAMADAAADRNGIDRSLFRALVQQESGWNPRATSCVGAQGLTQLMPGTAAGLGVRNAYDPAENLDGGARYLRQMLDANRGDEARALASYNAGFGRVNGRPMHEWPAETRQYVTRILSHARGAGV